MQLLLCVVGLQASYLTWGYVQEKVMTKEYDTGRFPSATFCVFSNRVVAILAGLALTLRKHGTLKLPAPYYAFAPSALANSLSSFGQYQALRYVSFPLQTLSKSTKVIPVMLMGKILNGKSYPWVEYAEALAISAGVSMFSLSEKSGKGDATTQLTGVLLIALYIATDSFTSQYQSRVYKNFPGVDQFQMMYATNMCAICLTLGALLASGELWTTVEFLRLNPAAAWDNATIAVTSATGQLFIFYTIKTFGPVLFTIIMTTRQMFSMMLSATVFGHTLGICAYLGTSLVFATVFAKMRRDAQSRAQSKTPPIDAEKTAEEMKPAVEMASRSRSRDADVTKQAD